MRTRPRDRWALQPENSRLTLWDSLLAVPIRPPGEVDTARGSHTFGVADLDYLEIVERRRALVIEPFKSLTDVGFDGPWVTPYQISSRSPDGPALVALHWLEEETIEVQRTVLEKFGYLPDIRFNTVIDMALQRQGLNRSDIYVTQTFHLIPKGRSERIPLSAIRRSFDEVTQYELRGRKVIALGDVAARECCNLPLPTTANGHGAGLSENLDAQLIATGNSLQKPLACTKGNQSTAGFTR